MKFDDIYDKIGACGPFQIYAFILISMFAVWSYHGVAAPFVVFPMDHWCDVPGLEDLSWEQQRYVGIPLDDEGEYVKCHRYVVSNL